MRGAKWYGGYVEWRSNIALHGDPNRAPKFQQMYPALTVSGRVSGVAPQEGAVRARERRRLG